MGIIRRIRLKRIDKQKAELKRNHQGALGEFKEDLEADYAELREKAHRIKHPKGVFKKFLGWF